MVIRDGKVVPPESQQHTSRLPEGTNWPYPSKVTMSEAYRFSEWRGIEDVPTLCGMYLVSADLKWSQFSRFKCEPLRSPAVRMHTPALAAIRKPQRSRLRVLQHELSVHTCSSRAIQSCPYCGIPVASIFVSTDREAGRNSSALRTAAPERMQGPWPERWSGWKVLTAGDPTFSRRFT